MRVSREFKQNFDLVARYYGLADSDELETAKDAVRRDIEGAQACFSAMAAWVRLSAINPQISTALPKITQEQIDAKTAEIKRASAGRELRDVRGTGRNDSVGAQQFRGAREGKIVEGA